ncbi:MAG: tetratricopeptide repeat protein [bacterium]
MRNHHIRQAFHLLSSLLLAFALLTLGCKSEYRQHYERGKALEKAGDFAGAAEAFQQAVAANPEDAKTFLRLGDAHRELGQWDKALGAYEKVLSLDPKYSKAYQRMVGVFERMGQLDEAIAAGEKGLASGAFDDSESRKADLEKNLRFLRNRLKDGRGVIGPVPMESDKDTTPSK